MAKELKNFLHWAISEKGGNAEHFMAKVHFVALPSSVRKLSDAQISKIHG